MFNRQRFGAIRSSRRVLLATAIAGPLLAACNVRDLYLLPPPTATGFRRVPLNLWHADAIPGERIFARELIGRYAATNPSIEVFQLPHGDPDSLYRRALQGVAGGVGPDVMQLPGEWIPEAFTRKAVQALDATTSQLADSAHWAPNTVESGVWQGVRLGLPAAARLRVLFFNDELLRNAGLLDVGRTTPPSTWAELADVSRRTAVPPGGSAGPEGRSGLMLPSQQADEELYRHVVQFALGAGGDQPRRDGTRVSLDSSPMREALQFLQDLIQKNGALPLDRPPFRLAETGRVSLWWAESTWMGDQTAVGATLRVGAASIPRLRRGGALISTRHWCLGANSTVKDQASSFIGFLATDEASHRYCSALSLPPVRRANWGLAPYTGTKISHEGGVWRTIISQLGQPDNQPSLGFPGYRTVAARAAGEMVLVLQGKKPIPAALSEGEAGVSELLRKEVTE